MNDGPADIGRADPSGVNLLAVELELRRIVGVVSARVDRAEEDGDLSVSLAVVGQTTGVSEAALSALRAYYDGPVDIDVIELSPAPRPATPPPAERVRLLGVHTTADGDQIEVHLSHVGRQAVGRTDDRRLIGVARATMSALRSLGADLPFEIEAVTSLGAGQGAGPVLVLLRGNEADQGDQRLGVVRGRDTHQATVRALLHALNRHLERAFDEEMAEALAG